MPKKTTEKNNKGKKNNTTKSTVSRKVESKNTKIKKVEPIDNVEKVETNKSVVKVEKKGKIKNFIIESKNNTPFVVSVCIIVLLLAALILTLCMKRIPKTSDGDEIIATLNGKTITANELYESLKESYGTNTLIDIIDTYISDKEVTIKDEDEDYVNEIVDYYKDYADYYGVDLSTFLTNYVGLSGVSTEDEFREYVLEDYKKTLAVKKFIGDNADEKDLKEYYKNNYSDKLTAKHILIEVDPDAEDQEKADKEAYNKAVSLIEKLNKVDKDKLEDKFDKLAEENSDDTATYSNGGLIEDFSKSDVVEEFFNAANKLKDGEYTKEPVKTTYGYHIILKISSKPVEKYNDIKNDVKLAYAESLLTADSTLQITKWDELRKQYKLSIKDDNISKIYKSTIKNTTTTNTDEETKDDSTESEK